MGNHRFVVLDEGDYRFRLGLRIRNMAVHGCSGLVGPGFGDFLNHRQANWGRGGSMTVLGKRLAG